MENLNIIDLNITTSNDITYLYQAEIIDFYLYKALQHINTYVVTDYQHSYRVSSNNIRTKQLWGDFKLWYKRSENKLTLNSLFKVLELIKIKTYFIDTTDYAFRSANASYKNKFYDILNGVRKQYQHKISA